MQPETEPVDTSPTSDDKFVPRTLIVLFAVWGVLFPVAWVVLEAFSRDVPLVIIVVAVGLINFVLGWFGGQRIKL